MSVLSSDKSTTILIPAAGWGSRMGFPNSKEILLHPLFKIPYIQFAMESVSGADVSIRILTRPQKTDLIEWVNNYKETHPDLDVDLFFVNETKEWPDTLLQSRSVWTEKNVVLLPDTDWNPRLAPLEVIDALDSFSVAYATFATNKLNWGFVEVAKRGVQIVEKPVSNEGKIRAWGMMGFQYDIGVQLLTAHLESTGDHRMKYIDVKATAILLNEFNDRTRGEQINV